MATFSVLLQVGDPARRAACGGGGAGWHQRGSGEPASNAKLVPLLNHISSW